MPVSTDIGMLISIKTSCVVSFSFLLTVPLPDARIYPPAASPPTPTFLLEDEFVSYVKKIK